MTVVATALVPRKRWLWLGFGASATMAALACVNPWIPALVVTGLGAAVVSVRLPEFNTLAYYIAGKVGYEERLHVIWGMSANQVFQAVVVVSLILCLARLRTRRLLAKNTVLALCILTIAMAAGLLYSDNATYGSFKLLSYLLLVVPSVLFLALRVDSFGGVQRVLILFLAISVGMMLLGLRNIAALEGSERLAVFGGGANVYARILGTGVLLLLTVVLMVRRTRWRRLAILSAWVLLPGYLVAMYFAGSKGPLLGLLLSFMLLAWLNRFLARTLVAIAVLALIGVTLSAHSRSLQHTIDVMSASRLFLNPNAEVSYGSYGSRIEFYDYSLGMFARNPLLGTGTGGWGSHRKVFEERSYPHNLFIEVLCEHGLVIFVLVTFYFGWMARTALRIARHAMPENRRILCSGVIACAAFWMINVQISGDLVDNRNLWIFLSLLESVGVFVGRHHLPALGAEA